MLVGGPVSKRRATEFDRALKKNGGRVPLQRVSPGASAPSVISMLGNAEVQRQLREAPNGEPSFILGRARRGQSWGAVARVAAPLLRESAGEEEPVAGSEQEMSGEVPAMEPEETGPSMEKGPCDCNGCSPDQDLPVAMATSEAAEPEESMSAAAAGKQRGSRSFSLEVGSLSVNYTRDKRNSVPGGHSHDAVEVGAVAHTFTNPGTAAVSPFGSESFLPVHSGAKYTTDKGKLKLDFTIDINAPWGVAAGGNTHVASGTDPVVTAEDHASGEKVYKQIAKDLTPVKTGGSMVPPRDFYWAKDLTEQHETFHSTEDEKWAKGAGTKVTKDYLNGKDVIGGTPAELKNKLDQLLTGGIKAMKDANSDWYSGGGKLYNDRPGEIAASAHVEDDYKARAEAVTKQGAKLEAAKAAPP